MLVDLYGRKTAKHSIISAFILQLFILIPYLLGTSLSNQSVVVDLSIEVSRVFEINVVNIITSLVSFSILGYIFEVFYCALQGHKSGKALRGPWCPIYGVRGLLMLAIISSLPRTSFKSISCGYQRKKRTFPGVLLILMEPVGDRETGWTIEIGIF